MDPDYTGWLSPVPSDDEDGERGESDADSADGDDFEAELPGESPLTSSRMRGGKELGDVEGEWVQGKRLGSTKVIYEGSMYTVNSTSACGEYLFGRCVLRDGCSSRLWIRSDTKRLHYLSGSHNHDAQPWAPIVARVRHNQMEMIAEDPDLTPSTVIKRSTEELDSTQTLYLPRKSDQSRAVASRKRALLGLPGAPQDIYFTLPNVLHTFADGERFLLHDSGQNDLKRFLIFGDPSMRASYSTVQRMIRLMAVPMFVPSDLVVIFWYDTIKPMIDTNNRKLHELTSYVERYWIGIPPTGQDRGIKPRYPPSLWNQHKTVMDKKPRHNNHLESNNRKLQALVKEKPTIWDFTLGLRSAYRGDFRLLHQEFTRGVPIKRKAANERRDSVIYNAVVRWSDTQGDNPALTQEEWANAMVVAMAHI